MRRRSCQELETFQARLRAITANLHEAQGAVRLASQRNSSTNQAIAAQTFAQAHQALGAQAIDIERVGDNIEEMHREYQNIIQLLAETDNLWDALIHTFFEGLIMTKILKEGKCNRAHRHECRCNPQRCIDDFGILETN
jgi:hypothetical protein